LKYLLPQQFLLKLLSDTVGNFFSTGSLELTTKLLDPQAHQTLSQINFPGQHSPLSSGMCPDITAVILSPWNLVSPSYSTKVSFFPDILKIGYYFQFNFPKL